MKKVLLTIGLIGLTACAPRIERFQGTNGVNGHSGVFANSPAPLEICPAGGTIISTGTDNNDNSILDLSEVKQIVTVCNGAQGATGQVGATRATGATGPAGSSDEHGSNVAINAVQFCPNVTTYPTTFSEVAICLNNQLYTVYSKHRGFLTKLPPGLYSSNGINSSCNFMVGPNCQVTVQ